MFSVILNVKWNNYVGSDCLIDTYLTSSDTEMILLKHSCSSISDTPWGVSCKLVIYRLRCHNNPEHWCFKVCQIVHYQMKSMLVKCDMSNGRASCYSKMYSRLSATWFVTNFF